MQCPNQPSRHPVYENAGSLSLLACCALLVLFLTARLGLPTMAGARAVLALYVLNVVPGYLALRFVFRFRAARPFEMMLASLVTGSLIVPLLWYVLCALRIDAPFFPAMYVLAVALPLTAGWHRSPAARLRSLITPADAPALWVALALTILWSWHLALVQAHGTTVTVLPYQDHSLHATFVAELARGVPMATVPNVAGAEQWAYHLLPDVWAEMMRRATGLGARDAYLYLALPLRYLLVAAGFYLSLVPRFGRAGAIAGVAAALGVAGIAGDKIFDNGLLLYLHASYPTAFGLAGVGMVLYSASLTRTGSPRGPLLLASFLSVLLLWHKANLALPVAPAVAILSATILIKRRDLRWLGLCLGVQAAMTLVRFWELSAADLHGSFVFNRVNYLYTWWNTLYRPPGLAGLATTIEALPMLVRWPLIYTICTLITFHVGLMSVPFLVARWRRRRGEDRADAGDSLTLLILACSAAGFVLLPVQQDAAYNVAAHIVYMVYAIMFTLLGAAAWSLAACLVRRGRLATGVVVIVAVLALVANGTALPKTMRATIRPSGVIDSSLYRAYRFIESDAPADALVLVPDYRMPTVGGLLTGRRTVLERAEMWRLFCDTAPLIRDIDTFYRGNEPAEARAVLDRHGIDYVVTTSAREAASATDALLAEVFRDGASAVFRVEPRNQLAARQRSGTTAPARVTVR